MVEVVKDIDKDYSHRSEKAEPNKRDKLSRIDLIEQIKALQRAFAQERGENYRFREEVRGFKDEVRALLRQRLYW